MNAVVEWLDTDPVTNKPEALRVCVPQGDGKHPPEFLQAVYPPFRKGMQNALSVGVIRFPAPLPLSFELSPYLRMVIDLTIEDHLQRPILIAHGLTGRVRKIDDGKPPMCQARPAARSNPPPCTLPPALRHGPAHTDEILRTPLELAISECQYSRDS